MIKIEDKQYYTAKELAHVLKVSKSYVCRLAREGVLTHQRTELGYLFPASTVQQDWEKRSNAN